MNHFPILQRGDCVDVIAPGSACASTDLENGVRRLEAWGLRPRFPPDLFGPRHIYAHHDSVRWKHLRKALLARDSKAVWCVRGGYGSQRLLPRLQRLEAPAGAKPLIGFSDITALQLHLGQAWDWPSLYAPVLAQLGRDEIVASHIAELKRILFGRQCELHFAGLRALRRVEPRGPSDIRGRLLGGNLRLICSGFGTPWQLRATPHILFLEDVNERGYEIDRMLEQMREAGVFKRTRAMVLGDFVRGEESNGKSLWRRVFTDFADSVRFPVLAGLPSGHGKRFRPIPLGLMSELHVEDGRGSLSVRWRAKA